MSDLKSCPWCKGARLTIRVQSHNPSKVRGYVKCEICGATGPVAIEDNVPKAIAKAKAGWNFMGERASA